MLINACDLTTASGIRDRAILLLLARLGLRAGDIMKLRIDDIDWQQGWAGRQPPSMCCTRAGPSRAMLTVAEIQQAYQSQVGREAAPSTIYRLLKRYGWRKLTPRPRHPKADLAAQAAFKKTALPGTPRGLAPG